MLLSTMLVEIVSLHNMKELYVEDANFLEE